MPCCHLIRRQVLAVLGVGVLAVAVPAWAQQLPRNFARTALRGEITFVQPPEVLLNGYAARLAPGARIRGVDNLLAYGSALAGQKAVCNYTLDYMGNLFDVWILRPEEAAKKPWPRKLSEAQEWEFDPIAQTWTKP